MMIVGNSDPPPLLGGGHWVIKMWQSITSSHTHWHTHTTHWHTHTTHTNTHTQTTQAGRSIPCGHTHPHKHTDTDTHTYTHTTQAGRSTHCGQVLPAFSNFQLRKQVELIEKAGRTYYGLTQEELWRCCSFGCQRGTELVFQNTPYIGAKSRLITWDSPLTWDSPQIWDSPFQKKQLCLLPPDMQL